MPPEKPRRDPDAQRFARETLLAAVAWGALYKASGPLLRASVPGWAALPRRARVDLRTRVPSTVHAALATFAAARALAGGDPELDGRFQGRSRAFERQAPASVGYFLADTLAVLANLPAFGGLRAALPTLTHHFIGGVGFSLCVLRRLFPFSATLRLTHEASTPFVNALFIMMAVPRWRASRLFRLNALALLLVFGGVRLGSLPLYYARAWAHRADLRRLHWGWRLLWGSWGLTLDAMNVYWLGRMVGGYRRS